MSVRVQSGANDENLNLAGSTIGSVRERFATALTIASDASATLNGESAEDTDELVDGDVLVFGKQTAEKG